MSDTPQHADPDLHAIFGIGENAPAPDDPQIDVGRVAQSDPSIAAGPVGGLGADEADLPFDTEPVVEVTRTFGAEPEVEL
ncbi:MAG TPA: hypothetical protein VNY34_05060, partial [Solirubrobacteraceae bacterium]|nr:hypothetical protein [Solirubrobacteraceae bacterium]